MAFVRFNEGLSIADLTFTMLTVPLPSPAITIPTMNCFYQTISEHREQGMTFDTIAEWLNKEGYLSARGKKFRGAFIQF